MTSALPLAARVDADCAEAGMEADYPLREILVTVAKAADDTRAAAERIGKEAGVMNDLVTAPFVLRQRPFLTRLRNHYRIWRRAGLAILPALCGAWRVARG